MTLTTEQKQALREGEPVRVIEPETQTECVLIRADVFTPPVPRAGSEDFAIPPGIRQAQAAFRRDLPALLESHYDQWALYHGGERIGIARTEVELLKECKRRGYKAGEYYLELIAPYILEDLEHGAEIDPSFFEFDEEDSPS
jgi:hypothetical protein